MRNLLLIGFLIISTISLSAKEITVDNPRFSVASHSNVIITKVVITDTATLLYFTVGHSPSSWIRMASDTYIRANGQKHIVQSAEGIELDKEVYSDQSGRTHFVLKFAPLSPDTQCLDFIESDCETCFKIWGVELKPGALAKQTEVPLKIKNEARIKEDGKSLEVPQLKSGKAVFKGQFLGYLPEMNWKVKIYVNNPVTGNQEELETTIREEGHFELEVPLVTPMQVLFRTPVCNTYILLAPGKTTTVCVDLPQKSRQETMNEALRCPAGKTMYFGGAYAEINNQLYDMDIEGYLHQALYNDRMSSDIVGMTAEEYKSYLLNRMKEAIEGLPAKGLTKKAHEFAVMSIQLGAAGKLMFGRHDLEDAHRKKHKLGYDDKLTGYVRPVFDQHYYAYLKDLSTNRPLSLYCHEFSRVVNSYNYITAKEFHLSYVSKDAWQQLIDSGVLSAEEKVIAEYQKKTALDNWDASMLKALKESEVKFVQELIQSGKLDDGCLQLANQQLELCNDPSIMAVPVIEKRIQLIMKLRENNWFKSQDEMNEMLKNLYQPELDKDDTMDPKQRAEQAEQFYKKYDSTIRSISEQKEMKIKRDYIAQILGTSEGLVFDLIKTQRLCRKFEEFNPLTAEELEDISRMKNPFYLSYLTEKNNALLAQIELNKGKKGYTIHDTPEAEGEGLFSEIIKPFEGKVVLIDFWATWCGPCRSAMKQFEPAKKLLKEKGVVFVYLTDETSPLNTWNNMIPEIAGEHYRLKDAQFEELKKKFGVNGVPSYLILNKKGEQVYFKVGFEGSDTIARLLQEELGKE